LTEVSAAIVRDYDELRRAIAARRHELGLTQLEVNFRAGLQDGYVNKIECGIRHFGDMSLGVVLEALGLELVVRPRDPEALP
jgi:transcriptional regulator with XRE-family HTH domain